MRLLEQSAFALQECAARGQCWFAAAATGARRVDGVGMGMAGWRTYTERLRSSLMALISIFLRPMVTSECDQTSRRIRLDAIRSTVMSCGWCRRVLEGQ
jgi:hypothetical protein